MTDRLLYEAALRGDAAAVLAALSDGANPRQVHWAPAEMPLFNGKAVLATPLIAACWAGSSACAEILAPLSDLAWADQSGATALMRACQKGHFACANRLASLATCAHRDVEGWTALFYACFSSHGSRKMALDAGHVACISSVLPLTDTTTQSYDRVDVRDISFHFGDDGKALRAIIDSLLEAEQIAQAAPPATASGARPQRPSL